MGNVFRSYLKAEGPAGAVFTATIATLVASLGAFVHMCAPPRRPDLNDRAPGCLRARTLGRVLAPAPFARERVRA